MINLILEKYNIKAESILKITSKVYRIYSSSGQYIFKYHPSSSLEVVFSRLSMLNLDIYLIPIRSIRGKYIENKEFAEGSMLPKIKACIDFVSNGENKKAIINSLKEASNALSGNVGKIITKN